MHVLFLSHYFPPEVNAPATRTYEHCRQWVKDGHTVTVVTCAPNHPQGKVYGGYKNRLFHRETKDGIHVVRVWTYVTANEGFLKRTLNYISYMASAVVAALFLPKADVVLSTSPQFFNGLAGYFVSRLKRIPWVLEIRDLWPESILAVGAIKNQMLIRMLERVELFAYRHADKIVPVTDSFKRYMIGKGIDGQKITVIKNGVDLEQYQPLDGHNAVAKELGLEDKFVVSYFGTHGMAHHLETIFEAAKEISGCTKIQFLLVGDGAERQKLLSMRSRLGLDNVTMLEQQPKSKMRELWALSHISLVLLKKSDLFKTVIPSKIFESLAMEKPILLGVEGESATLLTDAQAGYCIEPENAKDLAVRVLELFNNRQLCHRFGASGRAFVMEHFDRVVLARKLARVVSSACAGNSVAQTVVL
ncbi:putative UDP-alpha-N-acetylglucosamine 3-alpha-N-acetyl-L-fucosaminyltransferase [Nitrospira sp. KM1]|uniref:glycosyltransferase family 4 protein n=1 Tax=Nitrospira sp. KM1 TaxID=1936990 RepID=UPI0013A733BF|nr:glycosyltransferase family 4 protein [Nitrospira sp. KM1]BCA53552.1 putative UDP-alpha-N-acetylglucosamine 3-alpha-N-acetyl-L-fucosaminyltransferase [Nitrospira sp. KM1]